MLKNPRFWSGVCTFVLVPAIAALGLHINNMANEAAANTNANTNDDA